LLGSDAGAGVLTLAPSSAANFGELRKAEVRRKYYYEAEKKRRADVYAFAIYAEREPTRLDPLDIEAWEFLVLSTPELERHFGSQDSVALSRIEAVTKAVGYEDLRARVDEALG
jgi:hypothetical protein